MELYSQLKEEYERLLKIKEKTERSLLEAPEGTLRISKSGGYVQYYHCFSNSGKELVTGKEPVTSKETQTTGKDAEMNKDSAKNTVEINQKQIYLPKKEKVLAEKLAQKSYDERVLRLVKRRSAQIAVLLNEYRDDEVEALYLKEQIERQKLVVPVEQTYRQMIDKWMTEKYTGKDFKPDAPIILTNNGVRVRSKSEKIMADYFESLNIAYKYECPLYLQQYGTIYPDFTFISPKTRKKIYWEHEGMIDNEEYSRSAAKKIDLYYRNHIYPGENLILTFESSLTTIDTTILKELTAKYLI